MKPLIPPPNFQLIAFTGGIGAGKTTATRHLKGLHGHKQVSFANPIRLALHAMGFTWDEISDKANCPEEFAITMRVMQQTLGTAWGRDIVSQSIWITMMNRALANDLRGGETRFIIDDLRFNDEAAYVKSIGGKIIHIKPWFPLPEVSHRSEAGINPSYVDRFIEGDPDLTIFKSVVTKSYSVLFPQP